MKRLASSASTEMHAAHHEPTPFQRGGCEPSSILLGSRRAFTEYPRSLTLSWSPAGTPEPVSETARCAGRDTRPRGWCHGVDLQAEGP